MVTTHSDNVELSVVLTTYQNFDDRGGTLPFLIESLAAQDLPSSVEVIIVDDGSTDRTPTYVRRAASEYGDDRFSIRLLRREHTGNRSACRNAGADAAVGNLLLFIDDDTIPLSETAVRTVLAKWDEGQFLCGARRYWAPPTWDSKAVQSVLSDGDTNPREWAHLPKNSIKRRSGSRSLQEYTFLTNFGVVSQTDFHRVGGFDERYDGWGHEDTDLMARLLAADINFVNLWQTTAVLHMQHPLGFRRGAKETNTEVHRRKMEWLGLDFDLRKLFEASDGSHSDVLTAVRSEALVDDDHEVRVRVPNRCSTLDGSEESGSSEAGDCVRTQPTGEDRTTADLSIVVPTYNSFRDRGGSLAVLLSALEQLPQNDFEIVVVDDGSTDRTEAFLDTFAQDCETTLVVEQFDENTGNRALSRNHGAKVATGDVLVFMDDDTIPLSQDVLTTVLTHHKEGTFACGGKRYWSRTTWDQEAIQDAIREGRLDWLREQCVLPKGINRASGYRDLLEYTFLGNFGVVSQSDFWSVGGFDADRMAGYDHEDVDLMYRLYLNGIGFRNLHTSVSVAHLNHPLRSDDVETQSETVARFRERERETGLVFKVNHLFGVCEDDGTAVLHPIT